MLLDLLEQALLGEQLNVRDIGGPRKGPSNGAAFNCQLPTFRFGVQPCSPARHTGLHINFHDCLRRGSG